MWLATSVEAQGFGPRLASRIELTAILDSLENIYPILNEDQQKIAATSMVSIKRRLEEGDVWPGDVIQLRVAGQDRWTLDHTVTPTRTLELESIDALDMSGILYSELEESVSIQLGRYLREPQIQAQSLKRIGILGDVGTPGFYTLTGSTLVSDAVMLAGGPGRNADVDRIEFRRFGAGLPVGNQVVWQSMSLDDIGLQSGDEMWVPSQPRALGSFLLAALGIIATITLISIRLF